MNNTCLCVGKYTNNPYFIKYSEINLYSIEELCYYFMENIQILDQDIMTQEMVDWIRTECDLPQVAEELEPIIKKHMSLAAFVTTLFEKTKIYNESMIKMADRILKEQAMLSPFERWDKKAKQEYQAGRFHQAQKIYEQLLQEVPNEDGQTRARLYYNIASVYAMNFAYEEAAEYYLESYTIQQSAKTRIAYLLALRKSLNDFDYGAFKRGHDQWRDDFQEVERLCEQAQEIWQTSKTIEMVNQLQYEKTEGQKSKYYEMRDQLLTNLKKDYRRQTM